MRKVCLGSPLAFGLSSCASLSRDGSENRQQIAAQIKAGDVEVVERERPTSDNGPAISIPSTLAEARSVFLDHSPMVQDRLLAYEIAVATLIKTRGVFESHFGWVVLLAWAIR